MDRLIAAAAAYRKRFEAWPSDATITRDTLATFTDDLDDSQFIDLKKRLNIRETDTIEVSVSGPEGRVNYSGAEWEEGADYLDAANRWLTSGDA